MSYICTSCAKLVTTTGEFCPFCGQQNIEEEVGLSNGEKVKIYILSFVLAPLGLYWFIKYFKSEDAEKKKIGNVALIITFGVILLTTLSANYVISKFYAIYAPQLELYEELGY